MGAGCARGDRVRHRRSTTRREATSAKQQRFQEQQHGGGRLLLVSARAASARTINSHCSALLERPSPAAHGRARSASQRPRPCLEHARERRLGQPGRASGSLCRMPQSSAQIPSRGARSGRRSAAGAAARAAAHAPVLGVDAHARSRVGDRLHGVLYLVQPPLGREDGRARVIAARHRRSPAARPARPAPPLSPTAPARARPPRATDTAVRAERGDRRRGARRSAPLGPGLPPPSPLLAARALWRARARAHVRAFEPNPNGLAIKSH